MADVLPPCRSIWTYQFRLIALAVPNQYLMKALTSSSLSLFEYRLDE